MIETSTGVMSIPEFLDTDEFVVSSRIDGSESGWNIKQIRTITTVRPRPMVWDLPSTYLIYSSMDSDCANWSFSSRFLSLARAAK